MRKKPCRQAVAIIPARFASKRLPGKPLLKETGKYLIQHVYERVSQASTVRDVIIATDDERIGAAADEFGARWAMTSPNHLSGTDRIAEVARDLDDEFILNVQGDEPEIDPGAIDQLAELLWQSEDVQMATLAFPVTSQEEYQDPNAVKVVVDNQWNSLYFSRASIPYLGRQGESGEAPALQAYHHIGIYGFRREFLLQFVQLSPGKLEALERLEQLRALEHGHRIRVGLCPSGAPGIDSPDDYRAFVKRQKGS